ncbi:MAG TPA: GNAT family N-acetyltransferase [Terriglobales bacterium]|nr:GNAT family N-acetyltransferase [Terriglobales bacterium]
MGKVPITELEIRQAFPDDADAILNCLAAAFAPYREQYTPSGFADTVLDRSALQQRMQSMHVLVADIDGGVVGTVAGAVCHDGEGHLRGMAVLPGYVGTGIARALLNAIESWLKAQGCVRITLDTTLPLKAAMKFYVKHGYAPSGRTSDFFGMPLFEYSKPLD